MVFISSIRAVRTSPGVLMARRQRCSTLTCAKNGLFYATAGGKTSEIADLIKEKLGDSIEGPFDVTDGEAKFVDYENLIVGAPTWNTGADEDRSGTSWDEISSDEIGGLSGKKVACFGLGDAMSYGEHFCDAMGELHDKFKTAGATMVGYVDDTDYEYEESKSVIDGQFLGLPIDEDNEDDKSDARVEAWLKQLKTEMAM